jgi:antitoxin HicB
MSSLHTYLQLPYSHDVGPATYTDGRPCYLAEIPDLPGCFAYGDTLDEAMARLGRARIAYITHHHELNLDVPLPSDRPSHRWRADQWPGDASAFVSEEAFA